MLVWFSPRGGRSRPSKVSNTTHLPPRTETLRPKDRQSSKAESKASTNATTSILGLNRKKGSDAGSPGDDKLTQSTFRDENSTEAPPNDFLAHSDKPGYNPYTDFDAEPLKDITNQSSNKKGGKGSSKKTTKKGKKTPKPSPQSRIEPLPAWLPSPSTTFYSDGAKVTIIDWSLKIFVVDMLAPETCMYMRRLSDLHAANMEAIGRPDRSWRKLFTYTTRDLPCYEVPGLPPLVDAVSHHVARILGHVYGMEDLQYHLHPRSWKEPHLLRYVVPKDSKPKENEAGVEMHYDGSNWTWNLMLSDSKEYEGGGTFFRCLQQTIRLRQGQLLIHPGDFYHKGVDITSGERRLAVCFLDGFDPRIPDPSSSEWDPVPLNEENVLVVA